MALERRVWVWTKGSALYPNLYCILVGPPGVGKSAVLSQAERILRTVPNLHVAPSSVSAASLVDSLGAAQRDVLLPGQNPAHVKFHYLATIASELGVFLPTYDPLFMNSLTKFYDGEPYEERRRASVVKHVKIEHPHLAILGGTTPSYLNSFLPDGAWDQGFTSRTIFVYSGESVFTDIFGDEPEFARLEQLYKSLENDLKSIAGLYGKLEWTPEAAMAITAWNRSGLEPVPAHNKLAHYVPRRLAHVIKLCIVAWVCDSSDLKTGITLEHYQTALGWLLATEAALPDLFFNKGVAGDSGAIRDAYDFVFREYMRKEKTPVLEHKVIFFLQGKIPSHSVFRVLETMIRSKMLILTNVAGQTAYAPGMKDQDAH